MGANNVTSLKKDLNFLVVSANVGTLFENREGIEDIWLKELSQVVAEHQPHFIALHCQEIGGKDYKSSLEPVKLFFKKFVDCKWLKEFKTVRGFMDGDFAHVDQYTDVGTPAKGRNCCLFSNGQFRWNDLHDKLNRLQCAVALGNLYFVHNSVKEALIYDFTDKKFVNVIGKEIFYQDICALPDVKKEKFEQDFFPECKWSRKGYCRVRWKLYDKVVEFCNIHLFHDDNNLVSMKSSPSLYAGHRKRALKFVLERLSEEYPCENSALFLCGDFNFRLDVSSLVQDLCNGSQKQVVRTTDDDEVTKIILRKGEKDEASAVNGGDQEGRVIATFEKKRFEIDRSLFDPMSSYKCLRSYDRELAASNNDLKEFDFHFGPTYPLSEDVANPDSYMPTRCPSWCDRLLLMQGSWDWLKLQKSASKIVYSTVGSAACMGDHKPVYLSFTAACDDAKLTSHEGALAVDGSENS